MRLNVYLQKHGVASRRKADELILQGCVTVDGKVIKTLGSQVDPKARVSVEGKRIGTGVLPPCVYYLFHKPVGCLTSRSDPQGRPTIFDCEALKKLPPGVQAVGRLDFKSEGLLLLTNNGHLSLSLTHPRFCVPKTYGVLLCSTPTLEELHRLKQGLVLEDGPIKPLSIKKLTKETLGATKGQWLEVVVAEGRNHLIRRMMEALGLKVLRLVRVALGKIRLPAHLKPGALLPLSLAEVAYLENLLPKAPQPHKIRRPTKPKGPPLNDEEYALFQSNRLAKANALAEQRKTRLAKENKKNKKLTSSSEKNIGKKIPEKKKTASRGIPEKKTKADGAQKTLRSN